jgi:hypothetical protein
MNRFNTSPPIVTISRADLNSYIPSSRIQLQKAANPEITPFKQNRSDYYQSTEN